MKIIKYTLLLLLSLLILNCSKDKTEDINPKDEKNQKEVVKEGKTPESTQSNTTITSTTTATTHSEDTKSTTTETENSESPKNDNSTENQKDTNTNPKGSESPKNDENIIVSTTDPKGNQGNTNTGNENAQSNGSGIGSGNQNSVPTPELSISPNKNNYHFSSEASQMQITFMPKNGYEYSIEITDNSWLTETHSNDIYTFKLSENTLSSKRETSIIIKNKKENSTFKTIKVTQEGKKNSSENNFLDNVKWVEGVIPPTKWEYSAWDKDKEYPFALEVSGNGSGWYDINKDKNRGYLDGNIYIKEKNSCWLIVASNMIHWWFDRNQSNIERYNAQQADKVKISYNIDNERDRSSVYNILRKSFKDFTQGGYANGAVSWYLTNTPYYGRSNPKPLGVFKDVIPESELFTSYRGTGNLDEFSKFVKERLDNGDILGISYKISSRSVSRLSHIITIWGVQFDANGRVTQIFVTNSDDSDTEHKMYTLKILGENNKVYFKTIGGKREVYDIYYLEQGKKYWDKWS